MVMGMPLASPEVGARARAWPTEGARTPEKGARPEVFDAPSARGRAMTTEPPSRRLPDAAGGSRGSSGLMNGAMNTEEMITMKVRLLAVTFGFFLAAGGAYAGPTPG